MAGHGQNTMSARLVPQNQCTNNAPCPLHISAPLCISDLFATRGLALTVGLLTSCYIAMATRKRKMTALNSVDALAVGVPLEKMEKLFDVWQASCSGQEDDEPTINTSDILDHSTPYGHVIRKVTLQTSDGVVLLDRPVDYSSESFWDAT